MTKHTEFQVFKDYVGIKLHFNEWKFVWNPDKEYAITPDAMRKRSDKVFFTRLVTVKPSRHEWVEYMTSAFMKDRHTWIGDMFDEEIEDQHRSRMSHRRALEYNFRVDMDNVKSHLESNVMTLPELLKVGNSQPRIFETRIEGGITEESLAILDRFFGFTRQSTSNMLWEETRLRIHKYACLINAQQYMPKFKAHVDTLLTIT